MRKKKFKLKTSEIKEIINPIGGCFATDSITVDGNLIKIMIRDETSYENDSGWFFMSGLENQEYIDNPDNVMIYDVNTIANYDPAIIPFLNYPIGSRLERQHNSNLFEIVDEN